jgi:hypothetical protein
MGPFRCSRLNGPFRPETRVCFTLHPGLRVRSGLGYRNGTFSAEIHSFDPAS